MAFRCRAKQAQQRKAWRPLSSVVPKLPGTQSRCRLRIWQCKKLSVEIRPKLLQPLPNEWQWRHPQPHPDTRLCLAAQVAVSICSNPECAAARAAAAAHQQEGPPDLAAPWTSCNLEPPWSQNGCQSASAYKYLKIILIYIYCSKNM